MPKLVFLLISSILTLLALISISLLYYVPNQILKTQATIPTSSPTTTPTPTPEPTTTTAPLSYVCECKGQDKAGSRLKSTSRYSINIPGWPYRKDTPWTLKECQALNGTACRTPGYYRWSGERAPECIHFGCALK